MKKIVFRDYDMTCMERFHLQQGAIEAIRECSRTLLYLIQDAQVVGVTSKECAVAIEPLLELTK